MEQLAGKVAIITGASSGIGYQAALLFARAGARLVVTARRKQELQALVEQIRFEQGSAVAIAGDVREEWLARVLVNTALEHYGGLDIAFNNAGTMGPAEQLPGVALGDWNDTLAVNLTSAFLGAKYQIPAMVARGGGSLIFTSTFVGHTAGMPGMGAYAASKAGLIGLTQTIAAEYGSQGIRANALLPGGTDTPMGRAATSAPGARAYVEGLHALKRIADPAEIAQAALFLASDASSFVTGTALLADGGVSIHRA
ncbi:SDR family oxidoreductase [Duganella sp.]|uniref:SDR family oxidoreductase n=1 Tax=Duganella sp. TaxID=1904440 RepID=UPI0031E04380